jgi:hypothetical protein
VWLSSAHDFPGAEASRKKATDIAAATTRRDKSGLLLCEDQFVEAGEAQAINVIAVTDVKFSISLEKFSTIDLTVSDTNLTNLGRQLTVTLSVFRVYCHILIILILVLLGLIL